jgi:S-DNA-T family DNA segregation ATPase FtsK/SpoIIIE
MERRYRKLAGGSVRNIVDHNARQKSAADKIPYIVIIIDELADLMMVAGREVEQSICRLAQKARAAGLHLILATQRPSVDVITGLIKANLPSRISFRVASKIDSRTILDQAGAEYLLGHGDMLFLSGGRRLTRVHGAFISDAEVIKIVEHLKEQGMPEYHEEVFNPPAAAEAGGGNGDDDYDERYDEAVALVVDRGQASVSMVQRHLRVGYNRACRMVERMEADGLVSSPGNGGMRKVLAGVKDRMMTE